MWSILTTLCVLRAANANADGTHDDAPIMLQVNALADFGQLSKTPDFFIDAETLTSLDDWHSDRDLAFVPPPQNLRFTKGLNISIVTAVPVHERLSDDSYASYIAVVTDHPEPHSDLSQHHWNWTQRPWEYLENQSLEKTFIPGKEGGYYYTVASEETNKNNPKKENLTKHVSYVSSYLFCSTSRHGTRRAFTVHGRVLHCPWPVDKIHEPEIRVHLFTADGKYLGETVARQKPGALEEYNTMACVRDIYDNQNPGKKLHYGRFSGPFKQLVEWMEYNNLHGIAHFLIYTFRGQDVGSKAILEPYIQSKIASRVHFQHYPEDQDGRFGYILNDCLYRSKGHSKWLLTSIDIDEYIRMVSGHFFPGHKVPLTSFDSGPDAFLKFKKMKRPQVHSIVMKRIRFARSTPNQLDIASTWREAKVSEVIGFGALPKIMVNVDLALQLSIHYVEVFKGNVTSLAMKPGEAVIHHYRTPFREDVIYNEDENASTKDNLTTVHDTALQGEVALVRDAIQKRFHVNDVSEFLTELASRHPLDPKIHTLKPAEIESPVSSLISNEFEEFASLHIAKKKSRFSSEPSPSTVAG